MPLTPMLLHAILHLFPHRLGLRELFRAQERIALIPVRLADRLGLGVLLFLGERGIGPEGVELGLFLLVELLHLGLLVVTEAEFRGHAITHFLAAHLTIAIRRAATGTTGRDIIGPQGRQDQEGGTEDQDE